MDSTKKQKRTTIDFNTVFNNKSLNVLNKSSKDEEGHPFKGFSFSSIFSKLNIVYRFQLILRKFKKFLYRRFFWGRGVYYRFSVLVAILMLIAPVTVLAGSMKTDTVKQNTDFSRTVDTAFDTGNGKTSLPNNKTIESIENYVVQKGDTISSIAAKRDISVDTLLYANNLTENSFLKVGQTLKILPISGILYKVKDGDTLESLAKKYDIAKSGYSPQVVLEINLLDDSSLKKDQEILIPGAVIEKPKVTPIPSNGSVTASSGKINYAPVTGAKFINPTNGIGHISTCFSSIHTAVDIDSVQGPIPLYASAGGKVTYAGWGLTGGSGIAVVIDHGDGYSTQYYHMSRLMVSVGDVVKQGQQIGIMGSTGRSTGTHVHFIIEYNGKVLNPFLYVDLSRYPREYTATSC